jgi:pyrroline-5-carboxylate reductase
MRVGFAGAGNMAAAMARGWARTEQDDGAVVESMAFADAGSGRAATLAEEVGGEPVSGVGELPERSDVIVLAVKRTALDEVARGLGGELPPLISLLAGTPLARVEEAFPDTWVLRAMPNLAVEVRKGVICYVPSGEGPEGELEQTLTGLLGTLGTLCPVQDELIDAAMAIMACSPAYVALVAQALVDAAERQGLNPKLANPLVSAAVRGTAELLESRGAESIKSAVASPGGATEAGLEALARRDVEAAVQEAVEASLERMRA